MRDMKEETGAAIVSDVTYAYCPRDLVDAPATGAHRGAIDEGPPCPYRCGRLTRVSGREAFATSFYVSVASLRN